MQGIIRKPPMNDTAWSANDAAALYNVRHWSEGYFAINARGHVVVRPRPDERATEIDLYDLVSDIRASGLRLPVLVRFNDILRDRVNRLCGAFEQAMQQTGYGGRYTAVYPIKVNQQRSVVDDIVRARADGVGLEAGSKPELMAVLGLAPAGSTIVCNGYKDRAYVRLALLGQKLGHRVYVVIERLSELDLVLHESRALGLDPCIGLRVRLSSIGAGKWQNTGGEKSKFGLSASRVLEAVERLRAAGRIDALRMLHFHLGSQVANVRDIQRGLREASRFYVDLRRLGAPVDCIDVGGGLGVDYEGTRSRSFCSTNYSVAEYALNVVRVLYDVCQEADLPHPDVISESGRALTAHHAVLITQVIDAEPALEGDPARPGEDDPLVLHDLWDVLQNPRERPPVECYHDAANWLAEAQVGYSQGRLDVAQRAYAEQMYYAVCRRIQPLLDGRVRAHREVLDELREKLADKYFCNLSLFQSLPDVWAIDQIFPIVPIHRLDRRPDRRVVIGDITCDSDGRIDQYVDRDGIDSTLPAHALVPGEPYLLGFFMIGAYQEILGDMHNLFGDPDAVNVVLDDTDGWRLEDPRRGDRAIELLRYVDFDPEALLDTYRRKLNEAALAEDVRAAYLDELAEGLYGYTYLKEM